MYNIHYFYGTVIKNCRQLKQYSTESVNVIERREAVLEVESLSERPPCQNDGSRQKSDVMERVQKKRKIR